MRTVDGERGGSEVPGTSAAVASAGLDHLDHTRVLHDTLAVELVELVDAPVTTPLAVGAGTSASGPHPI